MNRDAKMDNLKILLIFFVVFGHTLESFCPGTGVYSTIRAIIYSFHMPAFCFLSGYFSKKSSKDLYELTIVYLSTYFIFNTLLSITPWRTGSPLNILFPQSIFWYLLSLWFWRVGIRAVSKIRYIVPLSIFMALYAGCLVKADRFLAVSKTICYFPFFLVGYFFISKPIELFSEKVSYILLIVCTSVTALANRIGVVPVKMYEYTQSYQSEGVSLVKGIIIRLFMILIAFVMVSCLLRIVSNKENKFTKYGRNTLMVYVLHIFPIKIISSFIHIDSVVINIGFCCAFSFVLCWILSTQAITDFYNKVMKLLVKQVSTD